jgi:hypothetical protein
LANGASVEPQIKTKAVIPGEGKNYSHVDEISKISIHGKYVELHLKSKPSHIWLGFPVDVPPLSLVHSLSEGDKVSIFFVQHGWGAMGVHKLIEVNQIVK